MKSLIEIIKQAENKKIAIGHFNVSDIVTFKAIFAAARELQLPVIIGVSEGEREFIGVRQIAALIKSLRAAPYGGEPRLNGREEYDYPIYLNADHTKSLEKIKQALEAGFDAAVFDASEFPLEENIKKTKEVVEYVKSISPDFLIEGELGYIGSGSVLLKEIPAGAAIKPEDLTKPEEAAQFIRETGVDLFAPAVGNLHGMFVNSPNPKLDIQRITEIKKVVGVPLVLHGGSGVSNEDFIKAIKAGISVIHINTELRLAWRKGIEEALSKNPNEIAPYKLLASAVQSVKEVIAARLKLFC